MLQLDVNTFESFLEDLNQSAGADARMLARELAEAITTGLVYWVNLLRARRKDVCF